MSRLQLTLIFLLLAVSIAVSQHTADPSYVPVVDETAFTPGDGPVIFFDEAHHNLHSIEGSYKPFADLLRAHHCSIEPSRQPVTVDHLNNCDIFVIVNARAEKSVKQQSSHVDEALSEEEIDAIEQWVSDGGALFLVADHMPMPGFIKHLAQRFGVTFSNGFAMFRGMRTRGLLFMRENKTLLNHWITDIELDDNRVDTVISFTGSAFRVEVSHRPLLVFGKDMFSIESETAKEFSEETKRVNIEGWRQGATIEHGNGRVVVFGEAEMFTALHDGRGTIPIGMQTPEGTQNQRLLINIIRWLVRQKV